MMGKLYVAGCIWAAAVWFTASTVSAETMVLRNGYLGYTGCGDTYLNAYTEDRNYGADGDLLVHLQSNPRRALVRFDQLPTLPQGYVIDAARLYLTYFDDYMSSGEWIDVGVHPLVRDDTWTEGSGGTGNDRSGAAWYYRHAFPVTLSWVNAGAGPLDRRRLDGTVKCNADGFGEKQWSGANLTDTVSNWYADIWANNGWVIDYVDGNDSTLGAEFRSSEYATALDERPRLEIDYHVIPEPSIGDPYWRSEIGECENSESPYGTFDQGGNVDEWNEAILHDNYRGTRGGGWASTTSGRASR